MVQLTCCVCTLVFILLHFACQSSAADETATITITWLGFEGVSGVAIVGGTLDAKGSALWAWQIEYRSRKFPKEPRV
ncbi:hypothetical protein M0R45_005330 [Rubus argutus]|uniref:Uncharacterized protein n=1 Tax=Rubus argutus TaxID=59490 RepID=A0AAW1YMW0_RUBAR